MVLLERIWIVYRIMWLKRLSLNLLIKPMKMAPTTPGKLTLKEEDMDMASLQDRRSRIIISIKVIGWMGRRMGMGRRNSVLVIFTKDNI